MSENTESNVTTPKATKGKSGPRTVPFAALKRNYCKKRGVSLDTQAGVNACKGMRQFIRSNRAALVKAGWKSLATHDKGAPYGDVPQRVATMIVNRKIG